MNSPRLVIVGLGNIGEATLPLIRRQWPTSDILVIDQLIDERRRHVLAAFGIDGVELRITRDNHARVLAPLLKPGAMLLNLAVDVCSADLIQLAQAHGAHYLDTCIDPWSHHEAGSPLPTGNYTLREDMLALAARSMGRPADRRGGAWRQPRLCLGARQTRAAPHGPALPARSRCGAARPARLGAAGAWSARSSPGGRAQAHRAWRLRSSWRRR